MTSIFTYQSLFSPSWGKHATEKVGRPNAVASQDQTDDTLASKIAMFTQRDWLLSTQHFFIGTF